MKYEIQSFPKTSQLLEITAFLLVNQVLRLIYDSLYFTYTSLLLSM